MYTNSQIIVACISLANFSDHNGNWEGGNCKNAGEGFREVLLIVNFSCT